MGFCLFNNVAIGAAHARARGAERILIVDWDVHHGNGTEAAFYEDDSVVVFNTHQAPYYPGTGDVNATGRGKGEGAHGQRAAARRRDRRGLRRGVRAHP
jgi:acetoin utilization deacetylase AcuC-like enzyme